MIVAAAVTVNGQVHSIPPPARHHTILHSLGHRGLLPPGRRLDQGFHRSQGTLCHPRASPRSRHLPESTSRTKTRRHTPHQARPRARSLQRGPLVAPPCAQDSNLPCISPTCPGCSCTTQASIAQIADFLVLTGCAKPQVSTRNAGAHPLLVPSTRTPGKFRPWRWARWEPSSVQGPQPACASPAIARPPIRRCVSSGH